MEKFILIDGNSLLNRAFYAMSPFSTRDGLPTNGIFGFVKLLFKILTDEKPRYLAVAFDVHAPTFRHKMYDGYKATRKPMPEELVRQVPVLKDLLKTMGICTVELAGYEADDVIGTLTRKFSGVSVLVYTGDRDAYQLVCENVDVCFTKRGVSDIDRLTQDNFYEKVGLTPAQIIEEKALMGDTSDNIPGVKGIGPKGALTLLQKYGTVEEVYLHLDELAAGLRQKLEEGREMAALSRTLATIDTDVPLSLTLEECEVKIPFSEEARAFFARLEFRSLTGSEFFSAEQNAIAPPVECSDLAAAISELRETKVCAVVLEEEGVYLFLGGRELFLRLKTNILDAGFFAGELRPLFEEISSLQEEGKLTFVTCDLKAFWHTSERMGLPKVRGGEDVMLLRYLRDSNLRPLSAKEFAKDFALPEENCAAAVFRAWEEYGKELVGTPEEKLYRELELPLEEVLFDMERMGVRVDTTKFSEFSAAYLAEMQTLSRAIYDLAGTEFNLNSPVKLSEILFDRLGYDTKGAKKTSRGGYSTNAEVLEQLAEDYEIARLILRYRELQKLQSTYIDGIRPLVADGVIHTTYNQAVTTTGRLSSANPNLQNIPVRTEEGRELRKLFIAREGNVLVDADYSQIELRLLAHFSDCKGLIEAYAAGEDIHAATAARVFGIPQWEVTPAQRRKAKSVNFGIIYGISAFGLAKDIGCAVPEAQSYIDRYFATYPEVRAYMDANVQMAKELGYVVTVLGRKRFIPELKSSNFNLRSFGERAAMNMPLQGSAADIIKIAMLRVSERLKREGLRSRLVLQVHDELILDAPEEEAEYAAALLREEMEGAISLKVPLTAEVSSGRSWYDAK